MASAKWYDEMVTVKMGIANRTPSPKVLIVGGSGTHFGVQAEKIQAASGRRVINFGLFADISLPVLLNTVASSVRPGDQVVLALEYELYSYDARHPSAGLVDYALNGETDVLSQIPVFDRMVLMFSIPPRRLALGYWAKLKGRDIYANNAEYDAATVNAFGDETSFRVTPRVHKMIESARKGRENSTLLKGIQEPNGGWKILEDFIEKSRRSGVQVLATFPNLMNKPGYKGRLPGEEQIVRFYRSHNVPVLGSAHDALYDPDLFYDTVYHLNEDGRSLRTAQLARLLRPYITTGIAGKL
jgi:hypothetical protein